MAREAIGVKRYVVRLTSEERAHLEAMLRKGKHGAKTLIKARILAVQQSFCKLVQAALSGLCDQAFRLI